MAVAEADVPVPLHSVGGAQRDVIDLLTQVGLVKSKSERRRSLPQGRVYVNGRWLAESGTITSEALMHDRWVLLRRGKQSYALVVAV